MSTTNPAADASLAIYGEGVGRGDLEQAVIQTIRDWIVAYVADYERQKGLRPRYLPTPPAPESIHGGIDYETFSSELFPEIIVVCQPSGTPERYGDGTYGSWFTVEVAAIVSVEGDQDGTRVVADAYGDALQKLLPQQGGFGLLADQVSYFATRTRLAGAYGLEFPNDTVRDIVRATTRCITYVTGLVSDYEGPQVPPQDPYGTPLPPVTATRVEVDLIRGTPDTKGPVTADGVLLDGTVNPPVVTYESRTVVEPEE